ncbi:hypothetical protein HB816_04975 [Listeria booriae]|uniref:hypothetical protein n=1 Tax=Listeria booriae TaxID=1552123 RepID=UPI0016289C8A|nr:hypothetical protein [Listeria booriae]MBC1229806.1 hypothetical protein [Listeria booriae]
MPKYTAELKEGENFALVPFGLSFKKGQVVEISEDAYNYLQEDSLFEVKIDASLNKAEQKRVDAAEKTLSELTVESEQAQFDACQKSIDAVKDEEAKAALQHKLDELITTKPPANKD